MSTETCKPRFPQERKFKDQSDKKGRKIASNQKKMSCVCELATFSTCRKESMPDRRKPHLDLVSLGCP